MSPSSTSNSEHDGLVPAPAGVAHSGWRRIGAPVIVVLFLALMGGAGIVDLIAPDPGPRLTRSDELARDTLRANARMADGTWMRSVDLTLQERSNMRETLVPWYVVYGLLPLGEAGTDLVVGKDGWLFLKERILPRGGTHRSQHGPVAANLLTALDRRLVGLGIDPVFLVLPRKATIMTAKLPAGVDPHPEYEHDIYKLLAERRVPHVNLFDVWEGLNPDALWLRQDTHWSRKGMWHALEAATRVLGNWVPPELRTSSMRIGVPKQVKHGLLQTLGIEIDHPVMSTLPKEHLQAPLVNPDSLNNLPEEAPSVVLIGTSFSSTLTATQQLSHLVDRQVLGLGQAATTAGVSLHRALASGSIPEGSQLVLEIPSFQLQGYGAAEVGPQLLQADMVKPMIFAEPPQWFGLPCEFTQPPGRRGFLARGKLASTGDGIVHIELSGRPTDAPGLRVSVFTGSTRYGISWPEDSNSLTLPVLAAGTGSPLLVVMFLGAPVQHDIRMRAVTELDLEHSFTLPRARIQKREDGEGWLQEHKLPARALRSRHAALWIQLGPQGPKGPLSVELVDAEGQTRPMGEFSLARGGTALLNLASAGGAWTAVRLSGAGPQPKHIGGVRLVDLPKR